MEAKVVPAGAAKATKGLLRLVAIRLDIDSDSDACHEPIGFIASAIEGVTVSRQERRT